MKRINASLVLALICAAGCSSSRPRISHESDARGQRPAMSDQAQSVPQMPSMTSEQIEKAAKLAGTPGEQHAMLKPYEGTWRATVKMWSAPNTIPEMSKGMMTNRLILGGRFLEQKYIGKDKGEKFEGQGVLGYDNVANAYVASWIDSMTTSHFVETGKYDPAEKVLTMKGKVSDPVSGKELAARTTMSQVENGQYIFEMYSADGNGNEYKNLEIVYAKVGVKTVK